MSGFNVSDPLQSVPVTGEVISVDIVNRVCTVAVQSDLIDDVTWYGLDPAEGDIVYLTATGDRMIAVMVGDADHVHDGYLEAGEVKAGSNVTITQNADGTITIGASQPSSLGSQPTAWRPDAVLVTDWNAAINNGFYMSAPGAANVPATSLGASWWYGEVVAHNAIWCLQRAWAFAGSYPYGMEMQRWQANGAWQPWRRTDNFIDSYGTLDGLVFSDHSGRRRFAHGLKSAEDEWRVQCYDANGNYTKSAIRVLQDGRVIMDDTLQSGTADIVPVPDQNTTKRIGFDKTFSTTPQVVLCPISSVSGSTLQGYGATAVDPAGFTLNVRRTNNTSTSFMWIATAD
jgi:hypothetical protein